MQAKDGSGWSTDEEGSDYLSPIIGKVRNFGSLSRHSPAQQSPVITTLCFVQAFYSLPTEDAENAPPEAADAPPEKTADEPPEEELSQSPPPMSFMDMLSQNSQLQESWSGPSHGASPPPCQESQDTPSLEAAGAVPPQMQSSLSASIHIAHITF